jgi:hypothetical protein
MKTDFNTTVEGRGPRVGGQNSRPSGRLSTLDFRLSTAHSGVALVITLILLSVVTFMAITFLALSRRERGAVTTATDAAGARLAADAALASAEAQIIANALSATNPFSFGLLVSTNYINYAGFDPSVTGFYATNVNYDHLLNSGVALDQGQFLQNQLNLFYSPRPPVFVPTTLPGGYDFRYYLDLNRNGQFDTNGWVTNVYNSGAGLGTTSFQVGDPEWIGVLEKPDQPHGPNNKFIARYAFIAVPVGNTLDLNAIHNQVFDEPSTPSPAGTIIGVNPTVNANYDGFFRNQGVGSWEINLAAFLADLNTNEWGKAIGNNTYYYYQYQPRGNQGCAFDDARVLLTYRYNNNYNTLAPANNLFVNGNLKFPYDNIDGYSDGPLQTTFDTNADFTPDNPALPWAGADNTNHFFTHQELFDPNKTAFGKASTDLGFTYRLLNAGTNQWGGTTVSTYDRYTFYRLLSQLGTDTAPEQGKMNLNYDNLDSYSVRVGAGYVVNPPSVTNLMPWTSIVFFTNAADRLLRAYTTQWRNSNPTNFAATFYSVTNFANSDQWTNYPAFGLGGVVTNFVPGMGIPVLVSNRLVYSPAVNRLLQLAANMYDATSTNFYPSVFRPIFEHDNFGNVFIVGYTNLFSSFGPNTVSGTSDLQLATPYDITQLYGLAASFTPITDVNGYVNVYGVPWIIGAKKGFPNFNKFGMQDVVQITRKLQIGRNKIPIQSVKDFGFTNQLYVFSVSNSLGIDCWNSYSNAYSNLVQIVVYDNLSMNLTNGWSVASAVTNSYSITNNIILSSAWPAWGSQKNPNSFIVPINTTVLFLANSGFYFGNGNPGNHTGFASVGLNPGWDTNQTDLTFPHFGLLTTNRLQLYMLDGKHVIDYVQFAGPDSSRDLNAEIQTSASDSGYDNMWNPNLNTGGVPLGIISQMNVSQGNPAQNVSYWNDSRAADEILGFTAFMTPNGTTLFPGNSTANSYASNYVVQVPYTPTVTTYEYTSWQANDPLVHYLTSDLHFDGMEKANSIRTGTNQWNSLTSLMPRPVFTNVNDRYQPWGTLLSVTGTDTNAYNLAYKDPLVWQSDNWDFPTNKFPTVGWLGRVHRGTPWQTVYLKASNLLPQTDKFGNNIGTNTWVQWTGDRQLTYGQYFDAANSAPIRDRLLFDLFTTAFNDNATRGTLSVNVGGTNGPSLAAWSALFSGMVVLTNTTVITTPSQLQVPTYGSLIINPAGPYNLASLPPLVQMVQGINTMRAAFTNADGLAGAFEHVGDILSTAQLTEKSPFLNWNNMAQQRFSISDEMYEWLPQQTMSLLRCPGSPRYVIYCYGQTLKPAPNGIYMGSDHFGLVTNYQVVSETATRAVVRFGSTLTNIVATNGVNDWYSLPVMTNNNAVIEQFNLLPPD